MRAPHNKGEFGMQVYSRKKAALFLRTRFGMRTTVASLATAASRGGGPRMVKDGRYANYLECDLVEWARLRCSGRLDSTSTPHNNDTGSLFGAHDDLGDIEDEWDYRNTGDRYFDEVTRLEEAGELDAMIQAAAEKHHYFESR